VARMKRRKKFSHEKEIALTTHFELLTKYECDEIVDILASIICDFLERDRKNERAKNN